MGQDREPFCRIERQVQAQLPAITVELPDAESDALPLHQLGVGDRIVIRSGNKRERSRWRKIAEALTELDRLERGRSYLIRSRRFWPHEVEIWLLAVPASFLAVPIGRVVPIRFGDPEGQPSRY